MYYYLKHFPWIDDGDPRYEIDGVVGSNDLRSLPQMGAPGLVGAGYAFAAFPNQIADSEAIYLGDSLAGLRNKSAAEPALGLGVGEVLATNARDFLWELVTQHADPTGAARWLPYIPTMNRALEVRLGGHGLIKSEHFDPVLHPLVLEVEQNSYRAVREDALAGLLKGADGVVDTEFHRRYLQGLVDKYQLPPEAFIPPDLPSETPLPRDTVVTDDFNRSNENLNASANWAMVIGSGNTLVVFSNQLRANDTNNNSRARHGTDLAGNDSFAEMDAVTFNAPSSSTNRIEVWFRYTSAADTAYGVNLLRTSADAQNISFRKVVTGSVTVLDTDRSVTFTIPDTFRGEASGTSMTSLFNGSGEHSFSDSAIAAGLRTGTGGRTRTTVGDVEGDDWSGGDLAAVEAEEVHRRRMISVP